LTGPRPADRRSAALQVALAGVEPARVVLGGISKRLARR
jgi:hypothetical protein